MKYIVLTKGFVASVDDEDWEWLMQRKWQYACGYAKDNKNRKMHRVILDAPSGMEVDHIDQNGLNIQRSNLRLATRSQNSCNRRRWTGKLGYRGVYQNNPKFFYSTIIVNKKRIYLGSFPTEIEA